MKYAIPVACVVLVATISGCVTLDAGQEAVDQTVCELSGGEWIESHALCCPKGCPFEEPYDADDILVERCEACWLPT